MQQGYQYQVDSIRVHFCIVTVDVIEINVDNCLTLNLLG
jgi:hypothetical protein